MSGSVLDRIANPAGAGGRRFRLLIVDDSAVARAVLTRMIEPNDYFEIVGAVSGAGEALALLESRSVDVILLDIEMPGRNGIAALPDLIAKSRGARVLIVSAHAEDGAAATVEALALGAADTLAKPGRGSFGGRFAEILAERLLRLGLAGPDPSASPSPGAPATPVPPANLRIVSAPDAVECIAIGGSTGGVHAVSALLGALPRRVEAPILITQHLPASFMPFFAAQMQTASGRPAVVAREGMALQPGRIHVAPGNAHLCVTSEQGRGIVRLSRAAAISGCMPSVDPMFDSLAEAFGSRVLAVVLSGMGRDGAVGAERLAAQGAEILVQDIDSSVVWGMPGAIARAGLASAVLPPVELARAVARRASAMQRA